MLFPDHYWLNALVLVGGAFVALVIVCYTIDWLIQLFKGGDE